MNKLLIILLLCVISVITQTSNCIASTGTDSLVDYFPLAVGNQWTYGYGWSVRTSGPIGTGHHDTGTVSIQIIDKVISTDSTNWFMQETSHLWTQYDTGAFIGPTNFIDTIELVELNQGQHRLYRTGDVNKITQSVFPFLFNVDSIIYRYNTVNTEGVETFTSHNKSGKGYFTFSFKQGVGLSTIFVVDGCTCIDGYTGNHSLRSQTITGVTYQHNDPISREYRLTQNYPNPFNPSTTISFSLSSRSFVSLKVFDLIGREVATIVSEEMQAGNYSRQWNASDLSSGIYFYRLQTGIFLETKKLTLLK